MSQQKFVGVDIFHYFFWRTSKCGTDFTQALYPDSYITFFKTIGMICIYLSSAFLKTYVFYNLIWFELFKKSPL